jgi:hypothetical protein
VLVGTRQQQLVAVLRRDVFACKVEHLQRQGSGGGGALQRRDVDAVVEAQQRIGRPEGVVQRTPVP